MKFSVNAEMLKDTDFNKKYNKGVPIPMRNMFGVVLKETPKTYYVQIKGKPEETVRCLHCNRPLTHKVSMHYGLGPICGRHFYIDNITEENLHLRFDEIRTKMDSVRWEGYIPKRLVKVAHEEYHEIVFEYDNKHYSVKTADKTKIKEIYTKANRIIEDRVYKG